MHTYIYVGVCVRILTRKQDRRQPSRILTDPGISLHIGYRCEEQIAMFNSLIHAMKYFTDTPMLNC